MTMMREKRETGRTTQTPLWVELLALLLLGLLALKLLVSFQSVVDLGVADEAVYLTRGVNLARAELNPQWAPLYSVWYFLLDTVSGLNDNLRLYDLNYLVLSVLGPLLLYFYLRRIQVALAVAFVASALYLLSYSNLGVTPYQGKFAVLCVLLALITTTFLARRFHYAVLLITLLLLSYIRPEYALAFVAAALLAVGVVAYRTWRQGTSYLRARSLWLQAAVVLVLTVVLVQFMGNPLRGGRSDFAFKQHFAINYVFWGRADTNPWSAADAIAQEAFGEVHSVPVMALNNPGLFTLHLATNAIRYPQNLAITSVLKPYVPKHLGPTTAVRGVNLAIPGFLLICLVLGIMLNRRYAKIQATSAPVADTERVLASRLSDEDPVAPQPANRAAAPALASASQRRTALKVWLARQRRCPLPAFCGQENVYAAKVVALFLAFISLPSVASSLLIFPRYHYLQLQAVLLLILLAVFMSNTLVLTSRNRSTARSVLAMSVAGALLLVLAPNLASGWSWPNASTPVHTDIRSTVKLLRSLNIEEPVTFMSYTRTNYSFNVYFDTPYTPVSPAATNDLKTFLQDQQINMIIWPDSVQNEAAFRDSEEFRQLLADPASYGFAQIAVPDATRKGSSRVLLDASLVNELPTAGKPESGSNMGQASPAPSVRSQQAQREKADALMEAGQVEEALALYRELVSADPANRATHMTLAAALAEAGRDLEALSEYEKISQRWPDFPWAHTRRGEIFARTGDLPAAIQAFETAAQLAPDDPNPRFVLAYAYHHAGMRDQAIAAFEIALAMDPDRPAARKVLEELKAANEP